MPINHEAKVGVDHRHKIHYNRREFIHGKTSLTFSQVDSPPAVYREIDYAVDRMHFMMQAGIQDPASITIPQLNEEQIPQNTDLDQMRLYLQEKREEKKQITATLKVLKEKSTSYNPQEFFSLDDSSIKLWAGRVFKRNHSPHPIVRRKLKEREEVFRDVTLLEQRVEETGNASSIGKTRNSEIEENLQELKRSTDLLNQWALEHRGRLLIHISKNPERALGLVTAYVEKTRRDPTIEEVIPFIRWCLKEGFSEPKKVNHELFNAWLFQFFPQRTKKECRQLHQLLSGTRNPHDAHIILKEDLDDLAIAVPQKSPARDDFENFVKKRLIEDLKSRGVNNLPSDEIKPYYVLNENHNHQSELEKSQKKEVKEIMFSVVLPKIGRVTKEELPEKMREYLSKAWKREVPDTTLGHICRKITMQIQRIEQEGEDAKEALNDEAERDPNARYKLRAGSDRVLYNHMKDKEGHVFIVARIGDRKSIYTTKSTKKL